jgi:hypothetical protein
VEQDLLANEEEIDHVTALAATLELEQSSRRRKRNGKHATGGKTERDHDGTWKIDAPSPTAFFSSICIESIPTQSVESNQAFDEIKDGTTNEETPVAKESAKTKREKRKEKKKQKEEEEESKVSKKKKAMCGLR